MLETRTTNGVILYNLACTYGLATRYAHLDESLNYKDREKLAGQYSAKAIVLLKRLAEAGFFRSARNKWILQTDLDFDSLRHRAEFLDFASSVGISLPAVAEKPRVERTRKNSRRQFRASGNTSKKSVDRTGVGR